MSAFLDVALAVGLLWFLALTVARARARKPRHVWGELDSAHVARTLARRTPTNLAGRLLKK